MTRKGCLLSLALIGLSTGIGLFGAIKVQEMRDAERQGWDMASMAGSLQADADFKKGKFQIFELSPENRSGFTGRRDGRFEIWYMPVAFGKGPSADELRTHFIRAYNAEMKDLAAGADPIRTIRNSASQPATNQ